MPYRTAGARATPQMPPGSILPSSEPPTPLWVKIESRQFKKMRRSMFSARETEMKMWLLQSKNLLIFLHLNFMLITVHCFLIKYPCPSSGLVQSQTVKETVLDASENSFWGISIVYRSATFAPLISLQGPILSGPRGLVLFSEPSLLSVWVTLGPNSLLIKLFWMNGNGHVGFFN